LYRLRQAAYAIANPGPEVANPGSEPATDRTFYTYDGVGNRAVVTTTAGASTVYTLSAVNAYTEVNHITYVYDANGNLTADGTHTYACDPSTNSGQRFQNRLVRLVTPALVAEYAYDGLGRRITQTVTIPSTSSVTIIGYLCDGQQVIEERDENRAVVATYVYEVGIDEGLAYHFWGYVNTTVQAGDLGGPWVGLPMFTTPPPTLSGPRDLIRRGGHDAGGIRGGR
jgi:YD repeat-containing protein